MSVIDAQDVKAPVADFDYSCLVCGEKDMYKPHSVVQCLVALRKRIQALEAKCEALK